MKKIVLILLLSSYLFSNIGKISNFNGKVIVLRKGNEINIKKFNFILLKDDLIITKKASKALLLFKDNTIITLGKNSKLSVNEFVLDETTPKKSKIGIRLGNGIFRAITGRIGKLNPKRFILKSKTASMGIRGTIFDIVVTTYRNSYETVKIGVLEGVVLLTNNLTGDSKLIIADKNAKISNNLKIKVKEGKLYETKILNKTQKELQVDKLIDMIESDKIRKQNKEEERRKNYKQSDSKSEEFKFKSTIDNDKDAFSKEFF